MADVYSMILPCLNKFAFNLQTDIYAFLKKDLELYLDIHDAKNLKLLIDV